jgi:hypothetical protein
MSTGEINSASGISIYADILIKMAEQKVEKEKATF